MKKYGMGIFLSVVFGVIALLSTGCGAPKEEMPNYEADKGVKTVRFVGFVEPPPENYYCYNGSSTPNSPSYITVERYNEMKECGIDIVLGHAVTSILSDDLMTALDCAAEADLKYIAKYLGITDFANAKPERMEKALEKVLDHEAFYGILAKDEPTADLYNTLGKTYNVYKQVTDKCFYVNLLPTYGVTDMTYTQYIEQYCAKIGTPYISVDHYPFNFDGLTHRVSENWLLNLEIVQNACKKYGLEHWEYLQGTKAFATSKIPDYYDLSQQIYVSMAYGTEVLQYYCYFTPAEFGDNEEYRCLIDYYGNRTDIYEAAKKINNEIHAFEHVFMNYVDGWRGVMTVVGSENKKESNAAFSMLQTPLTQHERIVSVESTQDMVIGAFEDADGYDGFLFTNYSIPGLRLNSNVTVNFKNATKAVCYIGGKETVVELEKGKLEMELNPGEGIFVIPVNA